VLADCVNGIYEVGGSTNKINQLKEKRRSRLCLISDLSGTRNKQMPHTRASTRLGKPDERQMGMEEPKANRLTFCRLSLLLESEGLREDRIAAARRWSVSTYAELRGLEASKCQTWMQAIRDAAPPKWDKRAPPPDRRLFDLRGTLLPMRHSSLAHALDGDGDVVINDIRKFLEVTSELAQHAELIFRGVAPNWQFDQRRRLRETNSFWDRCQDGFGLQQTKTPA
jgi:hypothetical protein